MKIDIQNIEKCFHCGEDCKIGKYVLQEKVFCCDGCKLVYEILNENNLCTYYDLNTKPGVSQKNQIRQNKFAFLDDENVQSKLIQFTDGLQTHVTFYLPQMHCSSCLWLLENIHKVQNGIVDSKVNFIKKEVFIVFSNEIVTLRKVVETLTTIGYEPHISLQEFSSNKINKTNKTSLYKVGIAGFCFANVMMMSFPEYLSSTNRVEEYIHVVFKYLIVLFSLPVVFYSATEFFVAAWNGIKNKFLNIDAPIALAIIITFSRSLYEIFSNTGTGYLDSMCGIVFFMLLGRILQNKTYQSISFDRDYKSFFPIAVNVLKDNVSSSTIIDNIKVNDIIKIHHNELIPVDGILSKGKASIDYSFVSGESLPVNKDVGEIVYAGGKQLNGLIELLVVKEVSQSYLTNLWNKDIFTEEEEQENSKSFIHILSKYFTFIVLAIAGVAATYWFSQNEYNKMWNTLTTVLIVACPCALLLASTFTNGNILRILSNHKLYLRHPSIIEKLTKINQIVFDKTGTITDQKNLQITYVGEKLNQEEKNNIASLLSNTSHPLSKSIVDYLNIKNLIVINNFKEVLGSGVEAWYNEKYYKIGSSMFVSNEENRIGQNGSEVFLMIDDKVIGYFKIIQKYRLGLNDLIHRIKSKFPISIISGDNDSEEQNLQNIFGTSTHLLFHQKPEEKLDYIKYLQDIKHKNVLYIGDGLNDAGALKQSNVGITITENSNNFTPASDGILDASQFPNLFKFLQFAKVGNYIIIISFVLSIVYNIIGLFFAVQGTLSPIIAAVLMPTSSISIILITYGLTEITAKKLKL